MQAKDWALHAVLAERQQWVIPVYQRTYAWSTRSDKQIPKLWEDLRERAEEVLDGQRPKPHFVGAIIYSQPIDQPFGTVNRRFLVDGQQRITTFSLALCAIRESARDQKLDAIVATIEEYLFNAKSASMAEPEREQFKLWSSSYDRPLYTEIAGRSAAAIRAQFPNHFYQNGNIIYSQSPNVLAAFWWLYEAINKFVAEQATLGIAAERSINAVLTGLLNGFQIVVVQLGQDDDAQSIFASLNGNAEPLTAFDLIRNDIFHRARKASEDDDALFEQQWKALETAFWKTEVKQGRLKRPRTDHLVTHALVAETASDVNVSQVANEYKIFAQARAFESVAEEVAHLLKYAEAYKEMEDPSPNSPFKRVGAFLRLWDTSTFHPLILWAGSRGLPREKLLEIFELIESYIVRRDLCLLTNQNYNRVVPGLLKEVRSSTDPYASIVQHLLHLTGDASRFPDDDEVLSSAVSEPVYAELGSKKLRFVFSALEEHLRTKFDENVTIAIENLTVEHVLPDVWSTHWPLSSGATPPAEDPFAAVAAGYEVNDALRTEMQVRQIAKHTLGNLTMITNSLNPSLGNGPWAEKKARIGKSLLALNRDICNQEHWGEPQIAARAEALARSVLQVWPRPIISTVDL
ncbi:DUF262 domain-containing protein [Sphingomonas sp. YL-JM2C]